MTDAQAAPQNLEAEANVLGAMMLSPAANDHALEELEPVGEEKFFLGKHGAIYGACRAIHISGGNVDPITVANWLEQNQLLDGVGGKIRIHEIANLVPASANVRRHAAIVREHWARRLILAAVRPSQAAAAAGEPPLEVLDQAEQGLLDVRRKIERGQSVVRSAFELAQEFDEKLRNPPDEGAGVASPWSFFPPLQGGRVYVIAGYTGDGKTVQAVEFLKAAAKNNHRVGFFSIEMPADDLYDRLIASFGIPVKQVQQKRIGGAFLSTYRTAAAELARWQFDIVDDPEANAVTMLRYQRSRRYDLIIVDHLHDIVLNGRPQDRRILLEEELGRIRTLARVENVPVILLAQLSRIPGPRPFPRPTLASLRETGKIEQIAWMVGFIWRKRDDRNQPENDDQGRGIAEFIVAKNRSGPIGTQDVRFIASETRYVELAQDAT